MAVIVGAPKGEESWWAEIIKQAFKDLDHLRRHGDFSDIRAGEIRLRLGVTFGEEDAVRFPFFPTKSSSSPFLRCPMVSGISLLTSRRRSTSKKATVSMQSRAIKTVSVVL
jgi:hypothetical protein